VKIALPGHRRAGPWCALLRHGPIDRRVEIATAALKFDDGRDDGPRVDAPDHESLPG
jgi:hypothetical protein